MHFPRAVPTPFDRRRYGLTGYERALSAIDQTRLGRVVDLAGPDTVVIVTGDHGEIPKFDRLKRFAKRYRIKPVTRFLSTRTGHGFHVYEDLVLVPLLLVGPGIPPGRRIDATIRHMDLFPTVLDLAGIDDPRVSQTSGQSLVDLFDGQAVDRPGYSEAVGVSLHGDPKRWLVSVRHRGWKYVKRASGSTFALWRLPDERRNVASRHPEVVAEMETLLSSMQQGASLSSTGKDLSERESAEVEQHLRELGYLD
jgi:arylsulfatase A-like enzyme